MNTVVLPRASLYCQNGHSDKEYHVWVLDAGDGLYSVETRYGRRGNANNTAAKTPMPVDLDTALQIYAKVVKEKLAKGYEHGGAAVANAKTATQAATPPVSVNLPQLLNPITADQAQDYIGDAQWIAQEKFDGERRIVGATADGTYGLNRKGQLVALPDTIASAIEQLRARLGVTDIELDGEQIGTRFVAFDILHKDGQSLRETPCMLRLMALDEIAYAAETAGLTVAPTAWNTAEKGQLMLAVAKRGGEGVVFKSANAGYQSGRPASGGPALKCKFVETATVRVRKHNMQRSVQMEVWDEEGAQWRDVGAVAIPVNHDVPKVGDIIEVRYLYAYRGGALYQPVYLGARTDVDVDACTTAQIKYKAQEQAA